MPGLRQAGKTQGRPSSLPQVRHTGRAFFLQGGAFGGDGGRSLSDFFFSLILRMGTGLLQDFFLCLHFSGRAPPRAGAFRTLLLMTCACPAPKDAGAFVSRAVSGSRRGIPRGGSLRRPVPSVPEAGPRAVKTSGRRYTVFFPCLPGKRRAVQGADGRVFRQKRGRSGGKAGEGGCGPVRSAGKRPAKGKNTESSACTALCGRQRGGFFLPVS